jgi:hypothetical protein
VFTAPVSGKYIFQCTTPVFNVGAGHTAGYVSLVTTGGTIQGQTINPANAAQGGIFYFTSSFPTSMTAGDTAEFRLKVSNSTKTVGINNSGTRLAGYLAC